MNDPEMFYSKENYKPDFFYSGKENINEEEYGEVNQENFAVEGTVEKESEVTQEKDNGVEEDNKKKPCKRKKTGKKVAGHKKKKKVKATQIFRIGNGRFSSQLPLKIMISLTN